MSKHGLSHGDALRPQRELKFRAVEIAPEGAIQIDNAVVGADLLDIFGIAGKFLEIVQKKTLNRIGNIRGTAWIEESAEGDFLGFMLENEIVQQEPVAAVLKL